jgi:hypothetical protein
VIAYVVEGPVFRDAKGECIGMPRVYVATEERAKEIAALHPERTWRAISGEDMPAAARENLLRQRGG